jgi:hypothetical protein
MSERHFREAQVLCSGSCRVATGAPPGKTVWPHHRSARPAHRAVIQILWFYEMGNPLLWSTRCVKWTREVVVAQMTPEVSRLLEQALSLSAEEQEALVESLIANLGEKVEEGVLGD